MNFPNNDDKYGTQGFGTKTRVSEEIKGAIQYESIIRLINCRWMRKIIKTMKCVEGAL